MTLSLVVILLEVARLEVLVSSEDPLEIVAERIEESLIRLLELLL